MFKKYLIIASKLDLAGINITTQLSQFTSPTKISGFLKNTEEFDKFTFYLVDKEIIYTESLDIERINQFDFVIFASKHKSEKGEKSLTIHAPGNWRIAEFGGENEKISPTSALFQKQLLEKLEDTAKFFHLDDYKVTLECTHHGPLINKPCVFIEIGSSEEEWKDRKAGFVVAKTIFDTINEFKENPYNEVAIGIGGPHYCPNFTKIQLKSNVAISHIIPQYSLPIKEEMIKEAVAKTKEELDFVLLDWKGITNAEERQRIIQILDKNYIRYEKTSDIDKR